MAEEFRLEDIDTNFVTAKNFNVEGLKFYNVLEEPFRIYGLILPNEENKCFLRMKKESADQTSEKVGRLNYHTAGGRVRFRTNSTKIAILASLNHISRMSHFPFSGTAGFDVYVDGRFCTAFIPPLEMGESFASLKLLGDGAMKEVEINFPLYSGVNELRIGLEEDAVVLEGEKYAYEKPIVYYGSSITQGACASRPGNTYEAIIARKTSCDFINLGFAGSAMGEKSMAEYIATLDMQIFVFDYDFNTSSPAKLLAKHEPFFKVVREAQPMLPIVMITRPSDDCGEREARREIIKRTYDNAKASGDENVYFIDGYEIMSEKTEGDGTVEGIHPNDYGFRAMAEGIGAVIQEILQKY